jgi:hypothetical protein
MSKHNAGTGEPLYIVVLHESHAEQQLRAWQKANPTADVTVVGARMRLFDQRSLGLFQISWRGNWNAVTVWDTWRRCHIFIE